MPIPGRTPGAGELPAAGPGDRPATGVKCVDRERWSLAGVGVIDVTVQSGSTVPCARQGTALVPLGKIERYAMGKVQRWDQDELRRLQAFKQTRRRAFDADPTNEARLARLKRDRHNYQRSQEMFASIRSVGLTDSFEDIALLVQALLAVGQEIHEAAPEARPVEVSGPLGTLRVFSTWRILPDG